MAPDRDEAPADPDVKRGCSADRRVTVRTTHEESDLVAGALAPDNTDSLDVRVDADTIVCTIERSTTGGLRSTTDDYVVNLRVADRVIASGRTHGATGSKATGLGETGTARADEADTARADEADTGRRDGSTDDRSTAEHAPSDDAAGATLDRRDDHDNHDHHDNHDNHDNQQ